MRVSTAAAAALALVHSLPLFSPQTPRNHDDLLQSVLCLRAEIRTSTSSMTSVPKPLKFLGDKFDLLKEAHEKMVS